jgi:hypothetical protein
MKWTNVILINKERLMFKKSVFILIVVSMLISTCWSEIIISNVVGGSEEIVNFKKLDEGESLSLFLSSNGEKIAARNMPEGSSLTPQENSSWLFEWTPNGSQSGHYSVGFYTPNNSDLNYKNVRIVVSNTQFMIPAGEIFQYLFTATDPEGDDVEITVVGLPDGSSFTGDKYGPKLFQWNPDEDQLGLHSMILTATDFPSVGFSKIDTSIIRMTVTRLSYEDMPYDFNKDGKINGMDFSMFSSHWMKGTKTDLEKYLLCSFPMSEGEGSIIKDSSHPKNDGIITGATWGTDGLYFDGQSDYVKIDGSESFDITTKFTISVWIKLDDVIRDTEWQKIVIKPYETFSTPWELINLGLGKKSNSPRIILTDGVVGGKSIIVGDPNTILEPKQWYHLAATYDGVEISLHVNGSKVASSNASFSVGKNNEPIYVGGRESRNTFNGYISNLDIYNYNVSETTILSIYENNKNIMNNTSATIVYVIPTDTRYHKIDCAHLSGATEFRNITIDEAEKEGFQPCPDCKPLDSKYTSYDKLNLDGILNIFLNND